MSARERKRQQKVAMWMTLFVIVASIVTFAILTDQHKRYLERERTVIREKQKLKEKYEKGKAELNRLLNLEIGQ